MGLIQANIGKVLTITGPGSGTLNVTLGEKSFSEDFDTDAATTVDYFIASHGRALNKLGYFAIRPVGQNIMKIYGVLDGRHVYSSNTWTLGTEALSYIDNLINVGTPTLSSGLWEVDYEVSTGGTNSVTITASYFDEATAINDRERVIYEVNLNKRYGGNTKIGRASRSYVS